MNHKCHISGCPNQGRYNSRGLPMCMKHIKMYDREMYLKKSIRLRNTITTGTTHGTCSHCGEVKNLSTIDSNNYCATCIAQADMNARQQMQLIPFTLEKELIFSEDETINRVIRSRVLSFSEKVRAIDNHLK